MIPAYPLQWPTGWRRMPAHMREHDRFGKRQANQPGGYKALKDVTIADGVERVRSELRRMGVPDDDLVISTNLQLRLDGLPRSGQAEPADPGVAVYWRDGGETRCMAIDRYHKVAGNLAAVAATLEAMRAIERHGGAEILTRAFTGFAALPGPASPAEWWVVLDLHPNARGPEVLNAYRRLRSQHHPDRGGSAEKFQQIEQAYQAAVAAGRA